MATPLPSHYRPRRPNPEVGENKKIYFLTGVPATGKSWIMDQLDQFQVFQHDKYIDKDNELIRKIKAASFKESPIVTNRPFLSGVFIDQLKRIGFDVEEILVTAPLHIIEHRYMARPARKPYLPVFKANHARYERTPNRFVFKGTSDQVLNWLKRKVS